MRTWPGTGPNPYHHIVQHPPNFSALNPGLKCDIKAIRHYTCFKGLKVNLEVALPYVALAAMVAWRGADPGVGVGVGDRHALPFSQDNIFFGSNLDGGIVPGAPGW